MNKPGANWKTIREPLAETTSHWGPLGRAQHCAPYVVRHVVLEALSKVNVSNTGINAGEAVKSTVYATAATAPDTVTAICEPPTAVAAATRVPFLPSPKEGYNTLTSHSALECCPLGDCTERGIQHRPAAGAPAASATHVSVAGSTEVSVSCRKLGLLFAPATCTARRRHTTSTARGGGDIVTDMTMVQSAAVALVCRPCDARPDEAVRA